MRRRQILRRALRAGLVAAAAMVPCLATADPVTLAAFAVNAAYAAGYINATIFIVASAAVLAVGTINARRQMRAQAAAARAAYNASLSDRTATMLRTDPPWRVVMGRCTVGGDIIAMFTSDKVGTRPDGSTYTRPDALRHILVHVATHEVEAIHEMTIAGVPVGPLDVNGWATSADWTVVTDEARDRQIPTGGSITEATPVSVVGSWLVSSLAATGDNTNPVGGSFALSDGGRTITNTAGEPIQVNYTLAFTRSSVRLSRYLGATSQAADPYLLSVVPGSWGATDNLPGIAYVVVTLDLEDPRFQGGEADFAFDVSGLKVLDPRDGQTRWTANPALLARQFLTAEWGLGCATDEVDDGYVIAAANACDAVVNLSSGANRLSETESLSTSFWTYDAVTLFASTGAPNGYMLDNADLRRIVENNTFGVHGVRTVSTISVGASSVWCLQALVSRHTGARNVTLRLLAQFNGQFASATFNLATGRVQSQLATGTAAVTGAGITSIGDGWFLVWVAGRPASTGNVITTFAIEMTAGTTPGAYAGDGSSALGVTCVQLTANSSPSDYIACRPFACQRRYTCHGAFTTDQAREGVMEEIARSMAGDIVPSAQWLVIAGTSAAPVMTLTDADLHGHIEIAQNGVGINDLINTVRGQYMPIGSRAARDYPPYSNPTFVAADGRTLATDRTWQFVNADYRAAQLARIEVERNRDAQIISFPAKLRAVGLRIGDRVNVTSAEYGFTNKLFRVEDYSFGLQTPVVLSLREDAAALWDLQDAAQLDQALNTDLPDPWSVPAPQNVNVASGTAHLQRQGDGTVVARVRVTWNAITAPYLAGGQGQVEVQWRRVVRDAPNAWQSVTVPADETGAYLLGAAEGDALMIGVTAVNALGARSTAVWRSHSVVGKTQPPADVAGLAAVVVPGALRITWTPSAELDYAATELRRGASWASGVRIDTGVAGSADVAGGAFEWPWPPVGAYTIWARHRDSSGNLSAAAMAVNATVTAAALGIGAAQFVGQIGGGNLAWNSSFERRSGLAPLSFSIYATLHNAQWTNPGGRLGGQAAGARITAANAGSWGFGIMADGVPTAQSGNVRGGWQVGRAYTMSFWARKVNGAGFGGMQLNWNQGPASVVAVSNPPLGTGYQRYVFLLLWGGAVEGDGRYYISVANPQTGIVGDEVHIDDLQIEEGEVATAWAPRSDDLPDGSVSPGSVSFSDLGNLVWNGKGQTSTEGWSTSDAASFTVAPVVNFWPASFSSTSCFVQACRDAFFGPWINVKPGEQFSCSWDSMPQGGGVMNFDCGLGVHTQNASGAADNFVYVASRAAALGGAQSISNTYTIPAGVARFRTLVQINKPLDNLSGAFGDAILFTNVVVRRMTGTALLEVGAATDVFQASVAGPITITDPTEVSRINFGPYPFNCKVAVSATFNVEITPASGFPQKSWAVVWLNSLVGGTGTLYRTPLVLDVVTTAFGATLSGSFDAFAGSASWVRIVGDGQGVVSSAAMRDLVWSVEIIKR
jgi:hypothetical protein